MSKSCLNVEDYPLAENRPEVVVGARNKSLDDLSIDAVLRGEVTMEDLRITPHALLQQAQIARSACRAALAANFERAAEMTGLPQSEVMRIYELLRPGRAQSRAVLEKEAETLRAKYKATRLADFIDEAAAHYQRRGMFRVRF